MKDQDVNRKFRELELKAEFLEQSKAECEQQIEDLRNERKDLNEQCLNLTTKNAELVKVNEESLIIYASLLIYCKNAFFCIESKY